MLDVAAIWTPDVQQQNYRSLLNAMSRPGRVNPMLWLEQDSACATAILATLLDGEVSLSDHDDLLCDDDWPLLQAENADSVIADYILCDGKKAPDFEPRLGTLTCPELSATVILQVDSLVAGGLQLRVTGPGVDGDLCCSVSGLHPEWLSRRETWVCSFPLGVDLLLVDRAGVLALPRTTQVELL